MKAQILSFHCVLRNKLGTVISSTYSQDVITCGPKMSLLRGLAKGLLDLKKGEVRKIELSAQDAYGFYDPALLLVWNTDVFPDSSPPRIGQSLPVRDKDGQLRQFRILDIKSGKVTLDGNHPLAGQDLVFEIEGVAAREATPEEIKEAQTDPDPSFLH